jgi:hypothetical protein
VQGDDAYLGIDRAGAARDRLRLRAAEGGDVVGDLALQVGEIDGVGVDDRQRADAGAGEVERRRRAEAAGADHERLRAEQALLALDADAVEEDVARIAQELRVAQAVGRQRAAARRTGSLVVAVHGSPMMRHCAPHGAALRCRKERTACSPQTCRLDCC